jgi:hypothetical protein
MILIGARREAALVARMLVPLLAKAIPLMPNLNHLAVQTVAASIPFESWQSQLTFERLVSLHLRTSLLHFPKTFLKVTSFPALEEFSFAGTWGVIGWGIAFTAADLMQADVVTFVNRHAETLRSVSIDLSDLMTRNLYTLIGSLQPLKKIESFKVVGRWGEAMVGDINPLQGFLDKNRSCLQEIAFGTIGKAQRLLIKPSWLQPITSNLPFLTRVKLGTPFDISPTFFTWIEALLPQLRTLWLSGVALDEMSIQKLIGLDSRGLDEHEDAGSSQPLQAHGNLRSLLLRMTYPTIATMRALARRFPSVRLLKLIMDLFVKPSSSRRVTFLSVSSLVSVCILVPY